jgi:DNA-binding XRE family transcriptional regulator
MPNIGVLLKQEITRLARREVRAEVVATRKASTQYRRHIAALRRKVGTLERQVSQLQRRVVDKPASGATAGPERKMRFVAKGFKSQRNRLGLSAAEFGRLLGVSAQSVYNWEQGHTSPRAEQLGMIATRRGIGKREAQRLLEQLDKKGNSKPGGR